MNNRTKIIAALSIFFFTLLFCIKQSASYADAQYANAQAEASKATSLDTKAVNASAPIATTSVPVVTTSVPIVVAPKAEQKSEGQQQWWQVLIYQSFANVMLPIFGTVLSALLFLLLRKLNIKVDLQMLDDIAINAAAYAEHMAANYFKEHGEKASSATKMQWAYNLALAVNAKLNLTEKANEKLRIMILSKVPGAKIEAANVLAIKQPTKSA